MALASFDGTELQSAREVLNVLQKYSDAIKRFRERKPVLRHHLSIKFVTFDGFMHALLNARKYVEGIETSASRELYHQHFFIDFINNTITLYKEGGEVGVAPEERGTMPLNFFYSNWESLFYPEELMCELTTTGPVEPPPAEIVVETPVTEPGDHVNTAKMKELLEKAAFKVWNHVYNTSPISEDEAPFKVVIKYSGAGDSGDIDEMLNYSNDKEYENFTDGDLESLVWSLIDTREPGFYNNDGGRGEMTITPKSFKWEHFNYYTDENQTVADEDTLEDEPPTLTSGAGVTFLAGGYGSAAVGIGGAVISGYGLTGSSSSISIGTGGTSTSAKPGETLELPF